jgi:hypothetical protein
MTLKKPLATCLSFVLASVCLAAEPEREGKQLQVFPKNLARQHLGSNLFIYNPTTQTYIPTEAAASWLDDDPTTSWPALTGKQSYLLVLSEPEALTGFGVSARAANGTISLSAGDEPTAPGSANWKSIATNIPLDSVNNKKLGRSLNHFAKYLLIETDFANPDAIYSLHVYGDKPAVTYSLRQREQSIDARAIFGQYVNNKTDFNVAGLYSGARVTSAKSSAGYVAWQRAIDDNPETALSLNSSGSEAGAVINYGQSRSISHVSVLTDAGAKGKLEFFATPTAAGSLANVEPTVSVNLDGVNPRASIDIPAVQASQLAIRWTPENGTDTLALREVATFNGITLNEYEVGLAPQAIAEYRPSANTSNESSYPHDSGNSDPSKDGVDSKDYKDPKKNPEPVALGPVGSPYLPGALGFPPNPTLRRVVVAAPVSP